MKLIVITTVKEFESDIKSILKEAKIYAYSYHDAMGYKDASADALSSNWFAGDIAEVASILFFAFIKEEAWLVIKSLIDQFNELQTSGSRVHLALLHIEQTNEL